jgi:hypothetical protein
MEQLKEGSPEKVIKIKIKMKKIVIFSKFLETENK